MLSYALDR